MEPILEKLKDNFYKWVIPITNKIVKNLSTLNESSLNQGYKDLGEEIYKAELDNSINYSEDKQNFLFDKLKTQEHQTSTLINILDNLPSNTIKEQYQYFDKLEYYTQYYRNLTPSNMSVERIGDKIEISGIQQSLMENATYSSNINIKQEIAKLTKHMLDQGQNILPLPKVILRNGDKENAGEFLGKTAYYDPNTMEIVLYTEGRHPKDIVRSFAHEMVHHIQNLEDRLGNISTTNTTEDDHLDRIEQEAYLDGNMTFRNWTDSLNENLSPFSKKIEECILSDIKEYGDIDEYKIDLENTYSYYQTGNFYQFRDEVNNIDIISKLKPLPKGMVEFKFYPIKDGKPLGFIKLPQPNPKIMNTIFKIFTDEILPNNQKILIQPSDYTRYRLFRAMLNNNLDGNQYRIDTKDDPIDQSVLLVQKLDNLNENIFLEQEDELTSEVINPDGDTFRYDEISKGLFTYKDSLDNLYFARIVYQPTNNPHFEFKVGWFENNNIKTPKYDPQLPPNSTAIDNIKRRNTVAKIYRDEILPFFKENQNYSNILLFKPISNSRFIFSKRLIQNHTPSDFKIKIGDDCIEIYNIKDIKERKKGHFGLNQYNNITFKNWTNNKIITDPVKDEWPQTFEQNLHYAVKSLGEIKLVRQNSADIDGNLTDGEFIVEGITYIYKIYSLGDVYKDGKEFYNIYFHPKGELRDDPTGDIQGKSYIKILSTMYKIILDFIETYSPYYIGISSIEYTKNYHSIYNTLTKTNPIPGYQRKDSNFEFETNNNKTGKFVVLKKIQEQKSKDIFGLNQFARELVQGLQEELVMEGRYDALSSKLASISLNLVKKAYEKSSKTKLGKYLDKKIYYKQGETPPDIQSKEQKTILFLSIPEDLPGNFQKPIEESFYFILKVQFVEGLNEYRYGGDAYTDDDPDRESLIEIRLEIDPQDIPKIYSEIYANLIDTIRHEIEHLTQRGMNLKPGKYLPPDTDIREKIENSELPAKEYFLLKKEIPAMMQGLYFKAKKTKRPYKEVVDDYLDKWKFIKDKEGNPYIIEKDKQEILKTWRTYLPSLSLPQI